MKSEVILMGEITLSDVLESVIEKFIGNSKRIQKIRTFTPKPDGSWEVEIYGKVAKVTFYTKEMKGNLRWQRCDFHFSYDENANITDLGKHEN